MSEYSRAKLNVCLPLLRISLGLSYRRAASLQSLHSGGDTRGDADIVGSNNETKPRFEYKTVPSLPGYWSISAT